MIYSLRHNIRIHRLDEASPVAESDVAGEYSPVE